MITWKLRKQGRRLLVLICNFIGTFKQIKTLALYRYLLTELALSTVAKVDHMLVQKVYTDLSNNQHQLRLFKVGNLKTIKLENQLDREHMLSCMFAITKYQCGNLQLKFTKKDRKSTRLNSSHSQQSRMPSSA